jgi:ribonuclease HI
LFLLTLAKEKIATDLSRHLQIFTDGSILDTCETGCAFVIPSLGIKREYKLDPGISIFTAEMYAILMACTFINDMPVRPTGIAILSDSALQALEKGGTSNSRDLQEDILVLIHQIICQGSDVRLVWIPSHVGIGGNEAADRAAKHAAQGGQRAHVGLCLADIKRKLKAAARSTWEYKRKQKCMDKGWLFLPGVKRQIPKLPKRLQRVISRLRTRCPVFRFFPRLCSCGVSISLEHLCSGCRGLPSELGPIWDMRRQLSFSSEDFLVPHAVMGNGPMRLFSDCIARCEAFDWI